MRPTLTKLLLAAAAALAWSEGTSASGPALRSATPLFLEAAGAPAQPEASVPVGATLAPLIERLRPSVVNISTTTSVKHPNVRHPQRPPRGGGDDFDDFFERYFGGRPGPQPEAPEEFRGASLGSGFLLNAEGYVLTNNHVVRDATDIRVRLSDGREYGARVVGRDQLTDVALIQLQNAPKDLPAPVVLGDSDTLRQGDFVVAMGSPFGLRDTATLGIVSAKHRVGINPGGTYDDFIQTDAAINPGNSGGPLFNLRGEVVGINTAIVSPQIGQGIGFAVPISLAKALLPQLREKGKVTRGFVGVQVSDLTPDLIQGFNLKPGTKGALVQAVVPKSPAEKAGLKPGDLITQLNGKAVDSSGTLTRAVALVAPGQTANLTVQRGVELRQFALKVAMRPEDESAVGRLDQDEGDAEAKEPTPKLGLALAPISPQIQSQLGLESDEGLVITNVLPDGPGDHANLRRGDVILEMNRQPVSKVEDVKAILAKLKENDVLVLRVRRGDQASFLTLRLGAN
ncbi:MAG TPA: Do family serine endopeptidase [Anaeromyxobacter sp.]|nr:Do family serine endopeptidase [Anaeromyxobacter sp.]